MTIPEKPLELDLEIGKLPLEASAFMDREEWEENPMTAVNKIRKFLIKHSESWTRDEINELSFDELAQVVEQFGEAVKRASVPLQS